MTTTTDGNKSRRKNWVQSHQQKLKRAYRQTQAHPGPAEPAAPDEVADNRRVTCVPAVYESARERYVEHRIFPAMRGICVREPLLRDARNLERDYIDWLVAYTECLPVIEDERERIRREDEESLRPAAESSQLQQCLHRQYEHDRATYLRRIAFLVGADATEATEDLDNGQLFDLWQWVKDQSIERETRVTPTEVGEQITCIISTKMPNDTAPNIHTDAIATAANPIAEPES